MPTTPTLLSVAQAAVELGLTERAVRHRIKAGTLAAVKLGPGTSQYVITRDEIDRAKVERAADTRSRPGPAPLKGDCQQCGATTEECREGVSEERTCCEWCDHYPVPDAEALGVEP